MLGELYRSATSAALREATSANPALSVWLIGWMAVCRCVDLDACLADLSKTSVALPARSGGAQVSFLRYDDSKTRVSLLGETMRAIPPPTVFACNSIGWQRLIGALLRGDR